MVAFLMQPAVPMGATLMQPVAACVLPKLRQTVIPVTFISQSSSGAACSSCDKLSLSPNVWHQAVLLRP